MLVFQPEPECFYFHTVAADRKLPSITVMPRCWKSIMRDIAAELKELRLHGMVSAWDELKEQDESAVAASKWLIKHLLRAEHTDRAICSVSQPDVRHQVSIASRSGQL
jgi:hypothetical protein